MLRCSVIGAKGYTGLEIIRLLLKHPDVSIAYLADVDPKPVLLKTFLPHLPSSDTHMIAQYGFSRIARDSDVVFLALPHRVSMKYADQFLKAGNVVIDLSADYRIHKSVYEKWYGVKHVSPALIKKAVYGLTELFFDKIAKAQLIANPGCFPTGSILGLAPLLKKGLIDTSSIVIDAKTGVSGAGRNPSQANHFGFLHENFKAYKVNQHQHEPEIKTYLDQCSSKKTSIVFVPHLLPVARGILTTIYVKPKKTVTKTAIHRAYAALYKGKSFIRLLGYERFPELHNVARTNFCDIGFTFDKRKSLLIVITAIDNLLKGAAGQAVQNMNVRCGFDETAGFF